MSDIHKTSDVNVARMGESITDVTNKNEFVETKETESVDKAGWIVRKISELGGYENVGDYDNNIVNKTLDEEKVENTMVRSKVRR